MNTWFQRPIIEVEWKSEWRKGLEQWQAEQAAKERELERQRKALRTKQPKRQPEPKLKRFKPCATKKYGPLKPDQPCSTCGTVLWNRNRTGLCKPCSVNSQRVEKRTCSKCPNQIDRRNKVGICSTCLAEITRKPRAKCSVDGCNKPLRSDNQLGICRQHSQVIHTAKLWQKRQEQGLCRKCESPVSEPGLCGGCKEREKEYKRRWRAKKREELMKEAA